MPAPTAIVVGAGLAGLTAALRLQKAGVATTVFDRSTRAGGLCGTFHCDGFEFVLAANDFGSGLVEILGKLGVDIGFHQPHTHFRFGSGGRLRLPPNLRSGLHLVRYLPDFLRFARRIRKFGHGLLETVAAESVRSPGAAELLYSLAYPTGIPPHRLRTETLAAELDRELGYGYGRPHTPVGGPQAMVDAMVRRLAFLGGRLELGVSCRAIRRDGARHVVVTSTGARMADYVVTSQPRHAEIPGQPGPAMGVTMLLAAVARDLVFPSKAHTLVHLPAGIATWMKELDRGAAPGEFGFHVFRSDLPELRDHYTLNVYFFLPRGIDSAASDEARNARSYVITVLDDLLPGFSEHLIHSRLLAPGDFRELHGMDSQVSSAILPPGFVKPPHFDAETGIYHLGNSVGAPGEHAGQAVRGAAAVAEHIIAQHQLQEVGEDSQHPWRAGGNLRFESEGAVDVLAQPRASV